MKKGENNQKLWNYIIYRFFYAVLLFGIALSGFSGYFLIYKPNYRHVLAGVTVFFLLLMWNDTGLRGRLLTILLVLAVLAAAVVFFTPARTGEFLAGYFRWLFAGEKQEADRLAAYGILQTVLLSVGCYLLEVFSEHFKKVRYAAAAGFLIVMLVMMFNKDRFSHMGAVLSIWYIVLSCMEWTKEHWKKEKSQDTKSYMIRMLPFCVLYVLLLSLLPSIQKPFDWNFVKTAYYGVKESVTAVIENISKGDSEDFQMAFTGFSEDGSLGGNIFETKQPLMTVQGNYNIKTTLYLTGKLYDTFDGRTWSTKAEPVENDGLIDTLETVYAAQRYDEKEVRNYISDAKISVRYRYFKSGYLFAPIKTFDISGCAYSAVGGTFLFPDKKGYGTEYEASFWQLNLDMQEFDDFLEAELPADEMLWNTLSARYVPSAAGRPALAGLADRRDRIHETYTAEPGLSFETKEYLKEIVQGSVSDIEKLRAIERELASFTYTDTPGEIPASIKNESDFLDYFLEKKEGYCSYFATAFVLLAREEGFPARYAEGFCVPASSKEEEIVYSDMSHAWPEVYFDGIGWIPFEPTPGYGEFRYMSWGKSSEGTAAVSGNTHVPDTDREQTAAFEESETGDRQIDKRLVKIIEITGALVIILILLIFAADKMITEIRYRHMDLEHQYLTEVRKNLWLLEKIGLERKSFETLRELKARGEGLLESGSAAAADHLHFLDLYEKYLYGKITITKEMLQETKEQQTQLLLWLKQQRKWYYYRIRLVSGLGSLKESGKRGRKS
ncbi:MAG TPA: transglutaminase-like domain-containing protein [Lachnospiraceae bacterium]|nr:transglutaminase-like domain-containing protein [Lachnospiraceae bacterium]